MLLDSIRGMQVSFFYELFTCSIHERTHIMQARTWREMVANNNDRIQIPNGSKLMFLRRHEYIGSDFS